ncbi:methyltransferase [Croceicoccus sp. BE223]|uniref:methyltransferase n=1 Tax=Croceicoccus sp. BE223 TaxID=2817716 RepID=UPI00285A20F8|nr:methyltransferase [Croceicoccus sp. BE223]MDR7101586.1 demethylspheroidene O-methyltransferase [Croceicoccus sp. BE223]
MDAAPPTLRIRRWWISLRNRIIASPRFQSHAARNPLLRPVARQRSARLFDLVAGFVYTQTLRAVVEAGVLDLLRDGPRSTGEIAKSCALDRQPMVRLLRAAEALQLVEDVGADGWMLGEQGAALLFNAGAQAMIRHHRLLYDDLSDPLAILRADRGQPTRLSHFWAYGAQSVDAAEYSQLMAQSQEMVADQVLATGILKQVGSLLDVGGGFGVFAGKVLARYPDQRVGVLDLPEVVASAQSRVGAERIEWHPGSFFAEDLPRGYDAISLVRILHDHDDDRALSILRAARAALGKGGRLIIAEPMAGVRGAERMGDAYFGFYLWAMGSGRPRRVGEVHAMLREAGFSMLRNIRTDLPVLTSLIVAHA